MQGADNIVCRLTVLFDIGVYKRRHFVLTVGDGTTLSHEIL